MLWGVKCAIKYCFRSNSRKNCYWHCFVINLSHQCTKASFRQTKYYLTSACESVVITYFIIHYQHIWIKESHFYSTLRQSLHLLVDLPCFRHQTAAKPRQAIHWPYWGRRMANLYGKWQTRTRLYRKESLINNVCLSYNFPDKNNGHLIMKPFKTFTTLSLVLANYAVLWLTQPAGVIAIGTPFGQPKLA